MRRFWFAAIAVLSVGAGSVVAVLAGSNGDRSQITTGSDKSGTTAVLANDSATDEVSRTRFSFNLDPLDIELTDYVENVDAARSSAVGVPWVARDGVDPTDLFSNDAQQALYQSMLECFPADTDPTELYRDKIGCFDPLVITAAATEPNPADVFVAINGLNVARPDLFTICHNASHSVGEISMRRVVAAYGFDADKLAILLDEGGGACMGGLMHGLLDAVGKLAGDISDFESAVQACLLAERDNLGYCTDAVGHAAWDGFESLETAPLACAYFPEAASRRECGEGILMRLYQRNEVEDQWYLGTQINSDADLARWNADIAELCTAWPSTPFGDASENPQEWCWSGSIYLLFKPVFSAISSFDNDYVAARPEVERLIAHIVATCETFPDTGTDVCIRRMGPYIGHVAGFDIDVATSMCALAPEQFLAACIDEAQRRIDNALG